jgi:hypothetical protein
MKEKLVQQTMFGTPAEDEQAIILADLRGHLSDLRQRLNNARFLGGLSRERAEAEAEYIIYGRLRERVLEVDRKKKTD